MHEPTYHCGNAAEGSHGLVGSSWKRDKGKTRLKGRGKLAKADRI